MRKFSFAVCAAVMLAAISIGRSDASQALTAAQQAMGWRAFPGVVPASAKDLGPGAHTKRGFQIHHSRQSLFNYGVKNLGVTCNFCSELAVFNTYGQETALISNRLDGPDGDWYDNKGNLYAANYYGHNVTEYNPGQKAAAWAYTLDLDEPDAVTTDAQGNVYVADFGDDEVFEYAHRTNKIIADCFAPEPTAIAVDAQGDVFLEGFFLGALAEFKGGLASSGCFPSFGSFISYPGVGLTFDKNGNLLAVDNDFAVNIIPPPYTSTLGYIFSYYGGDYGVALNRQNNLVFLIDTYGYLEVLTYPQGFVVDPVFLEGGYGVAAD